MTAITRLTKEWCATQSL